MAWKMHHNSIAFNQKVITHGKPAILPFDLDYNLTFDIRDNPERLLLEVRKRVYIALVVNCHGAPAAIELGSGINIGNLHIFGKIKPFVKEIWFAACNVAANESGKTFCQKVADYSNAYVVASSVLQKQSGSVPKYHIREMNKPIFLFTPGSKEPPEKYNWTRPDIPAG